MLMARDEELGNLTVDEEEEGEDGGPVSCFFVFIEGRQRRSGDGEREEPGRKETHVEPSTIATISLAGLYTNRQRRQL